MVLNYAYAKIYRNVVVDEKLDFKAKLSKIHIRNLA
jgi:hypothetical protein